MEELAGDVWDYYQPDKKHHSSLKQTLDEKQFQEVGNSTEKDNRKAEKNWSEADAIREKLSQIG